MTAQINASLNSGRPRVLVTTTAINARFSGGLATHERRLALFLEPIANVTFIPLGSTRSLYGRLILLRQLFKFLAISRKGNWQHIIVNSPMFSGSCIKLALLLMALPTSCQRKLLVFFHGGRLKPSIATMCLSWFRFSWAAGARYFFLSSVQKEQFESTFGRNLPTAFFANYSDGNASIPRNVVAGDTRFIFVGRLTEQKGIRDCLLAFSTLCQEEPGLRVSLKVCGDGPLLEQLKAEFSWFTQRGTLSFLGHVSGDALAAAYSSSDVLVLPTRYPEGFPYVLIEAYQNGLCVLTTPQGALAEHVVEGVTGYLLYEQGIRELKERMRNLARDSELLSKLTAGAGDYFYYHFRFEEGSRFYRNLLKSTDGSARSDVAVLE